MKAVPPAPARLFFVVASLLLASLTSGPLGLLAADDTAAEPPLRYRRIYAPQDRIQDWPRGDADYVPIEPDEFQRLVDAARSAPKGATSAVARLVHARYEARLDDGDLLVGQARFEISHPAQRAAMLPLDPCGLGIEQARWEDPSAAPAVLGAGPGGKFGVVVARPGNLLVDWSLRGRRDTGGGVGFSLELPRCAFNTLQVDLPEDLVPSATAGVISDEMPLDNGFRRWRIELGGNHRATLRVASRDATTQRRRLAILQEDLSYEFSPLGLDVRADLKLDVHHEPLRRLEVVLDRGLQFASAHYGETAVPWSVTTDQASGETHVTLEFPEPILGSGRTVRLVALAPLVTDQHWRLPRMRPLGLFWQEASATLLVPAPLSLRALLSERCRQSKINPLPEPLDGESIELQFFSPDATAVVELSRTPLPPRLDCSVQLDFGQDEMTAQWVGRFEMNSQKRLSLQASVDPHWTIESVDTAPAGGVRNWELASESGSDRLTVRLKQPLTASQPLRLVVRGRASLEAMTRTLAEQDVRMLVCDAVVRSRLLAAAASGSQRLRVRGNPDRPYLDPQGITSDQRALFLEEPRGFIFDRAMLDGDWGLYREKQTPRFAADLAMQAVLGDDGLTEAYSLRCRDEDAPVDRLLVHLTAARPQPPRWSLADEDAGRLTARRWTKKQQAEARLPASGETWEVQFDPPRSDDFTLNARRTTSFDKPTPLSLAILPEAGQQQATLQVHLDGSIPLAIRNARLEPVAGPVPSAGRNSSLRASYRYDPAAELGTTDRPAVVLASPSIERPAGFVWSAHLDSRLDSTGRALNVATFRLQSSALTQCNFKLPAGSSLAGIWIDGAPVAAPRDEKSLAVRLPPDNRFPLVVLRYVTDTGPLGLVSVREARWPTVDLPVLSRRWTVWLPPDFEVASGPAGDAAVPRSWAQRLLGVVGRPASSLPFNPLAADQWAQLSGGGASRDWAHSAGRSFLRRVGQMAAAAAQQPSTPLDYRGLLEATLPIDRAELLVDSIALARAGITPRTPIAYGQAAFPDPVARGGSVLRQAGLVLICGDGQLLLSTVSTLATDFADAVPLQRGALFWVSRGPGPSRTGQLPDSQYAPIHSWAGTPQWPWPAIESTASDEGDHLGWTAWHFDLAGGGPQRVQIVRRATIHAAGLAAFALALAIGRWFLLDRPRWLVAATGSLIIIALLIPGCWAPIASGAMLGALAALLCNLAVPRRPDGKPLPRHLPLQAAAHGLIVGIAGTLVLAGTARLKAQEAALTAFIQDPARASDQDRGQNPAPLDAPAQDQVYRVFIPTDGDGKPIDGRWQVPADFLGELRRRALLATEEPRDWLIADASYRATLGRGLLDDRIEISSLNVRYDFHVFTPGSQVRIPLSREGANLQSDGAMLDGRAVELDWEEGGQALLCEVSQPGAYHLDLNLRPVAYTTGPMSGFELAVPPLPTAMLEIVVPADMSGVEVPGAVGEIAWSDDHQRLLVHLGASPSLAMQWPRDGGQAGPEMEVDELLWLKIRPGSVALDARLSYRIVEGRVRQLRLAADQRLLLLPPGVSVREYRSLPPASDIPGSPQTIELDLDASVDDQLDLDLSLLLTQSSGVGNLRLPSFEALGGESVRRWLAVSVDPALEYVVNGADNLEALAPADFAMAWGDSNTQPPLAYRLTGAQRGWSLTTRPREPRTTVKQNTRCEFGRASAAVDFDAQLLTTAGHIFQHRVLVPQGLEVYAVSVVADGRERLARWTHDQQGVITAFFNGRLTGPHQLTLQGRLATPLSGTCPLPSVAIEQSEILTSEVVIDRQPGVLVSLDAMEGFDQSAAAPVPPRTGDLRRRVAALVATADNPTANLRLEPNAPRVTGVQAVSLRWESQAWLVQADLQMSIESGLLDWLLFEVPDDWTGPFQVSPPSETQLFDSADDSGRRLLVRPHAPLSGRQRLSIRGPLKRQAGKPVALPDIVPQGLDRLARIVLLPLQRGLEPIGWATTRLAPDAPPEGFNLALPLDAFQTYRVVAANPRATIKPLEETAAGAYVRLADLRLAWQPETGSRGLAIFDVEPLGRSSCELHMPAKARLVHLAVGGIPASAAPLKTGTWLVPLGPRRLPQRIEVVWTTTAESQDTASADPVAVPRLIDLPIHKTLWSLCLPQGWDTVSPDASARRVQAAAFELARAKNIVELMDLSAESLAANRRDDVVNWYSAWVRPLTASIGEFDRQLLMSQPGPAGALAAESRLLEGTRSQTARRLNTEPLLKQHLAAAPPGDQAAQLWRQWCAGHDVSHFLVGRGGKPPVLRPTTTPSGGSLSLGLAAVAVGLTTAGLVLVMGSPAGAQWLRSWPHLIGVAAGLAWWLWASPSVVGWLVVAASLWSAGRSAWRSPVQPIPLVLPVDSYDSAR